MADFTGLTNDQKETMKRDGLLVLEDFLTAEEVSSLKASVANLVEDMDPAEHRGVFSTTKHNQARDKYFLDSGDQIRFFFEADSFDPETNELKLPKDKCLNKIGHALHWKDEAFKKVTFSSKMKAVARDLGLLEPVVVQGMYIFKQPRIGTEVTPHQDGSFLANDPLRLFGFWLPLDDATLENGCLWYAPGSHSLAVGRHFVRNRARVLDQDPLMVFKGEDPVIEDSQWKAAPVKKGALVLIHGQVMHKSFPNTSPHSRHAYTFHMVETVGCKYNGDNWLQPTQSMPFPKLFEN